MIFIFFALLSAALGLAIVGAFVYVVFINVITFFNLFPFRSRDAKYGFSVVITVAILFLLGAGIFNASLLVFMGCSAGFIIAWGKLLQTRNKKESTAFYHAVTVLSFLLAGGVLGALTSVVFSVSLAYMLSTLVGLALL